MKQKAPIRITFFWLFLLIAMTVFLLLSLLNSSHPFFDSLADIRVPLALILILGALPLFLSTLKRQALMLVAFALMMMLLSWQSGGVNLQENTGTENKTLTFLQANLRFDNANQDLFLNRIQEEKPDIITFQEGSKAWQATLDSLKQDYPYRIDCVKFQNVIGATGILSRLPFAPEQPTPCPIGDGVAVGSFVFDQQNITVLSIHLHWPWPYRQASQLDELEKTLKLPPHAPRFIGGDFNAVTWSNAVKRMEKLTSTKHISGIGPTWLSYKMPNFLRPILGLPLDQALISVDFKLLSRKRGPSTGSDHLPVIIQVTLPQ